jgi:hypothetical protein
MKHIQNFKNFIGLNESIRVQKISPDSYMEETVVSLPYLDYIKENRQEFLKKLVTISKDLGVNPLWILHTIFHESKFDPKKTDKSTGSVGILSFYPDVLKNMVNPETGKNYTPQDVLQLSNVDQLDLVFSYYKTWMDRMKMERPITPGDFASLTFYPQVIKKDWEWNFPRFVIEKNPSLFKNFESNISKNKEDYYDYIDKIFKEEKEYEEEEKGLLGDFTGALAEPGIYGLKKPLEYYQDLILSIENPNFEQGIQSQDSEQTQKFKQQG